MSSSPTMRVSRSYLFYALFVLAFGCRAFVAPARISSLVQQFPRSSSSSYPAVQLWHRKRSPSLHPSPATTGHPSYSIMPTSGDVPTHKGGAPEPPPPPPPKRPESAQNFLYWIVTWPTRDLLPEVRPVTVLNMAWTALIIRLFNQGQVYAIDPTPHSLLSGALGFFLTFRANEGYNRCNEARQVWDGILDTCRDIVRSVVACESKNLLGPVRARRILDLICAYGILLEEFVANKPTHVELDLILTPADSEALAHTKIKPLLLVERISEEIIAAGKEEEFGQSVHYSRLLGFVDQLSHHVTHCQRLTKPTVPRMFYSHALRFLTLWTFTLPFALLDKMPLSALVPSMGLISWSLFGLRELGIKTQYPFSAGFVDLRSLWREITYDVRSCFEGAHAAKHEEEDTMK